MRGGGGHGIFRSLSEYFFCRVRDRKKFLKKNIPPPHIGHIIGKFKVTFDQLWNEWYTSDRLNGIPLTDLFIVERGLLDRKRPRYDMFWLIYQPKLDMYNPRIIFASNLIEVDLLRGVKIN